MTNFSSKEARFEKLLRDARLFSEGRAFFSFPSDAAISRDASGIPPLSKRASAPPGNSKLPSESIRRALVWLYAQGASIPSEPLLWRVPWLAILPRERARRLRLPAHAPKKRASNTARIPLAKKKIRFFGAFNPRPLLD